MLINIIMFPHHFPRSRAHGIFPKYEKYYVLYPWYLHNSDATAHVDTYDSDRDQLQDKLAYTKNTERI